MRLMRTLFPEGPRSSALTWDWAFLFIGAFMVIFGVINFAELPLGWMIVMTGMTTMDIWVDDRAELQEHTVYFAAFAQLLIVVIVLGLVTPAADLVARLRNTGVPRPPTVHMPEQRGAGTGAHQ
jgi:uncharacterized membrane protein